MDKGNEPMELAVAAPRKLLAPLPPKAHVKYHSAWRQMNAQAREHEHERWQVDAARIATMCLMATNTSAAKAIEHGIVFQMRLNELAASDALKQQCFPDPNVPMALALVRCRRDTEQWLVLLADIWQHTNKIKDVSCVVREVKQADKMLKGEELRSTTGRVVRLGEFLQSLDPAEIQYAPSVNLTTDMVSLHT